MKKYDIGLIVSVMLPIVLLISLFSKQGDPRWNIRLRMSRWGKMWGLIRAQAKHETGNYTSRAFRELNNMFGMKHAVVRKQLGLDTGDKYRYYKSTSESIHDLLLWLEYQNFPVAESAEDYASKLKNRGYFSDSVSNYADGLKRHMT